MDSIWDSYLQSKMPPKIPKRIVCRFHEKNFFFYFVTKICQLPFRYSSSREWLTLYLNFYAIFLFFIASTINTFQSRTEWVHWICQLLKNYRTRNSRGCYLLIPCCEGMHRQHMKPIKLLSSAPTPEESPNTHPPMHWIGKHWN